MPYRQLGRSGLLVSELCLGAMIFGERSPRATPPRDARRMLDMYHAAGGNFIDTADVYAGGRSEEIVGAWLKGKARDQVVIATKARFSTGPGVNDVGLSRHHILAAAEASLRRLGTDTIDLYYAHNHDPLTPLEESLRAFDDLVTAGKVRYIGVSNFPAWEVMKGLAISEARGYARFVAAQYQYSLIVRDIEHEFTPMCQSEGLGLLPWGPLGGGFLSGKYRREGGPQGGRIETTPDKDEEAWSRRSSERNWAIVDEVGRVAEAHGASMSQVALAWLLAQPGVCSVILGARTPAQLEDNLGAATLSLSEDELARLDAASAPPEQYPYRMLEVYGGRSENG